MDRRDRLGHDLGVELPIFQVPIGAIATPELPAAVSESGSVGHLACTWREPNDLAEQLNHLTARPYGANFVLDFPVEDRLAVALEHGVPIVSFFWVDGACFLPRVRAVGAVAIQAVASVAAARQAEVASLF